MGNWAVLKNFQARSRLKKSLEEASATKGVGKGRSTSVPPPRRAPLSRPGTGSAGAVDEESFYAAFEDVPRVQFFSGRELQTQLEGVRNVLSDTTVDWEKRVDALKLIRSLMVSGAQRYDEFMLELKLMGIPLQAAAKDLRSQVVREACITVAYLTDQLGTKADQLAETLLTVLINLIPNSAKVMATSGLVACRFILKNVQSPRLVPIITGYRTSRAKEIRRSMAQFIQQMLESWPTHALERNVREIQETIQTGLSDADAATRAASRKAYWQFAAQFPSPADALFQSLDATKQRQLKGEMSQSSSAHSIVAGLRSSQENLVGARPGSGLRAPPGLLGNRSTSDIDTGAARKAALLQRHAMARQRQLNSISRPTRTPTHLNSLAEVKSSPHSSRSSKKSASQPGSRSGSPSSRLTPSSVSSRRPPRAPAGLRPGQTDRDQSPSRNFSDRRISGESNSPYGPGQRGLNGRVLHTGRDMEVALADALRNRRRSSKGSTQGMDEVDGSDASSICSDRAAAADLVELAEVLRNCASTQWNERKEGLHALQAMFRRRRPFAQGELKKICDVFSRMFVDPHNKTFNLFLDCLVEFLCGYRAMLGEPWLYTLIARILTKMGTDMLASMSAQLSRTVDVVLESFPYADQWTAVVKFILDPLQTPNMKVKLAILQYLINLCNRMDGADFMNTSQNRQAISRVIQWYLDPKSSMEVKRASKRMIVALFQVNAPEFTSIMNTFNNNYKDAVYKVLHAHGTPERHSNRDSMEYNNQPVPFDLDDVHNSLRETSAEIQNYNFATSHDGVGGSCDSGIVDSRALSEWERQDEMMGTILSELSHHNRRESERIAALEMLSRVTRDGAFTLWNEHFKSILMILIENLGDEFTAIRIQVLKVLQEISAKHPEMFQDYAVLTILRVLEAHRDSERSVVRGAETCATALATNLPPSTCLRVLNPILQSTNDSPVLMPAIKMTTKVVQQLPPEDIIDILPDVMPGIIRAAETSDEQVQSYNHTASDVRKASVLCLVAFHHAVGNEKMQPFLTDLSSSKRKLLEVYVEKNGGPQSPSPT